MRPQDLAALRTPQAPSVSPDGRTVCYHLTTIDLDEDAYRSGLFAVPADGSSPPRRLTYGPRDVEPRFSPDGRWIAFRRTGDGGHAQLHVMPVDGGEPRKVCEHPLGVTAHRWAPDSRRIAYVARVPEEGRYGTDPAVTPDAEPPRRVTRLGYRADNVGWVLDRRAQVFVVDAIADDPEPLQLTDGDFEHASPAWHPDGAALAFVSARHEWRDLDFVTDVFVVAAGGGEPRQVTRSTLSITDATYDAGGERIVFRSCGESVDIVCRPVGLYTVPADGSAEPTRHTDEETDDLLEGFPGPPPLLACEGDTVTTVRMSRGGVQLVRFDLAGGPPTTVLDGQRRVTAFDRAGGVLAATVADAGSPGEVVVVDPDGKERTLTCYGEDLRRDVALRPLDEIEGTGPDGYPVHGWVVKPAGEGPFPVLLNIHGGPHAQYGWTLFDEAQVYAGAGYAVVMGNPRGSQGYGRAHARAIVGDIGGCDERDILALLDRALEDPDLDGERLGVMGGSYGGLMTTLLAGRHDRFAAAVSERAVNAFDSFAGTSDIGATFPELVAGPDPQRQRDQSPLAYADGIDCPMLIIHSEEDWRCPLEQAQRLFTHLRKRGVPVEMLVFPGEGHELSRSGRPSHRVARFEAILEWWRRHLP